MERSKTITQNIRRTRSRRALSLIDHMSEQVRKLRDSLSNFSTYPSNPNPNLDYSNLPNQVNLIFLGPSGSGKSSLIRSFYRAYHFTPDLPLEMRQKVIVKNTSSNEGTTLFCTVTLKEESKNSSGIKLHDTRGQIWMDSQEQAETEILIEGRVKDESKVEERTSREVYLLWEFWKDENHLFPSEIIRSNPELVDKPHCLLFVFDGSIEEIPNGAEETIFYRDVLEMARIRGYEHPLIILTHYDCLENVHGEKTREIAEMKIESVVMRLGVPRSSVHFVENYEEERCHETNLDFELLRLLYECVEQSTAFLEAGLKEKSSCELF